MTKKFLILFFILNIGLIKSASGQLSDYELKILTDNNILNLKDQVKRISDFKNGYAQIVEKNGKANYINNQGQKVYPYGELIAFTQERDFPKKYFLYLSNAKKQGLVDTSGKIILPADFDEINYYDTHGYLIVRKNNKSALLNADLNQIIGFEYDYIASFLNDTLVVVFNSSREMGVLDIVSKQIVIPFDKYERFTNIKWGILGYKDGYCGLFNLKGEIIIPFNKYKRLSPEQENKFVHGTNEDGHCVMDSTGKIIIPPGSYNDILGYTKEADMFLVQRNGLWGAIDIQNKIVIPIEYQELEGFSGDGISRATKNGQTFFLSKKNYNLGNYKFDLYNGYRMYRNNDTIGYVDLAGQIYPFPQYQLPNSFIEKEIKLVHTRSMKWGIINSRFELLVDTLYDEIRNSYDGYLEVRKNNKYGVVDLKGKIQIEVNNDLLKMTGSNNYELTIGDKKRIVQLKRIK